MWTKTTIVMSSPLLCAAVDGLLGPYNRSRPVSSRSFCCKLIKKLRVALSGNSEFLLQTKKVVVLNSLCAQNYDNPKSALVKYIYWLLFPSSGFTLPGLSTMSVGSRYSTAIIGSAISIFSSGIAVPEIVAPADPPPRNPVPRNAQKSLNACIMITYQRHLPVR